MTGGDALVWGKTIDPLESATIVPAILREDRGRGKVKVAE